MGRAFLGGGNSREVSRRRGQGIPTQACKAKGIEVTLWAMQSHNGLSVGSDTVRCTWSL